MPLLTIDPIGSRFITVIATNVSYLVIVGPVTDGVPTVGTYASLTFGTVLCPEAYIQEARHWPPSPADVRVLVADPDMIEELMKAYPAVPRSTERPMPALYDGPLTKREKDLVRKQRKDGER